MKPKVFFAATAVAVAMAIGAPAPTTLTAPQRQTIVVTSTADSGPGTLREALGQAPAGTAITFDPTIFPPDDPATIAVTSALPGLVQGQVTIDASNAGVILDGSHLPRGEVTYGLLVTSNGNVIQGLQILHFPGDGISVVRGASHNTIGGDRTVGVGPSGQGNVVSGNGEQGITIGDPETSHNVVTGNYIGIDPSGSFALGNGTHGIMIQRSADNTIGGNSPGERNIISGNGAAGVRIEYPESTGNIVIGNYIGLDPSGSRALGGNNHSGVVVAWAASHNRIGGFSHGEGNIVSGNGGDGVHIEGPGTDENFVIGNFIGTDASGTRPLGNSGPGITLLDAARNNLIGGTTPEEGNVVSGNDANGVVIAGSGTINNTVSGNYIGIDATGSAALGNQIDGVWIAEGAQYNIIGGSTPGERNVISGNGNNGAVIDRATYNTIGGNYIGTDATGTAAVGNGNIGVVLAWGAQHNLVGGATPEERNLISGNGNVGVSIANRDTMSNIVSGNYIGTDVAGAQAIGNAALGVHLNDGARHNVVGGATLGEGNLISGNGVNGVNIGDSDTMWNVVAGNYIGTDFSGTAALGNVGHGVHIDNGARLNVTGPGNIIAHNGESGVKVVGADTLGNTITANSIYGNGGSGIINSEGGNDELPPSILIHVGTRIIRGTAPPNSSVEVFSDEEDEGRVFEGTVTADMEGNFTFRMPQGRFTGPNVTASAIDSNGNTSEFSSAGSAPAPLVTRELPGIVGPTQVSVEPRVVGTNLGLAVLCVLFFGLTSNAFNAILRDYRDELLATLGRFAPQALLRGLAKIGPSLGHLTKRDRGSLLLTWLFVLLLTSLIESFLDPQLGVLTAQRLGLLVTLLVSGVAASGLELGSDLYAHRRWAPTIKTEGKVQWVGIVIAAACVLVSRALDFKPGYLYGIVGAIYVMPQLSGVPKSGKRALVVLLTVFAGGLILWIATAFLPAALAEIEPLFLTVFLISLQGVFFALIPLAFTDGGRIWDWSKSVWFAFFTVVFFGFYHFLLNPNASDVRALQQNGVQTVLMLIVVFGLATIILWMLFPLRLRGKRGRRS
ncbi:MAG: hypothetical protein WBB22_14315 [Anaerolineae bacterium]